MRRALAAALVATALAVLPGDSARAQDEMLVVRAGAVYTGTGQVFRPGVVVVQGGKITQVGGDMPVPADARVLDAGPSGSVIPGLVAAFSQHTSAKGRHPENVTPDVRALDGYDFARDEARLLAGGVTTVLLAPGVTQVVSGRAAVVKTAGADEASRTLLADAGVVAGLGDAVQTPPATLAAPDLPDATDDPLPPHRPQLPATRAGSSLVLRRLIDAAREGAAPLRDVASGDARLFLGARTAGDVAAALDLLDDSGLDAVIVGALAARRDAKRIAASGVPVVLTWAGTPGGLASSTDVDAERFRVRSRASGKALADAGVRFALTTERDDALHELLFAMASSVQAGLNEHVALSAVTSEAAAIAGVAGRVGSIAVGKDADLVLLSGLPGDLRAVPTSTIVDGRIVWQRVAAGTTVVIRAAQVHIGDGRVLAPGEVAFEGGRIVEVGPTVGVPPGARIVDLGDGAVVPGFIDAHSSAGLAGSDGKPASSLATSMASSDAVDPGDPALALLAEAGVTSILCAPTGNDRIAGRASVIKTQGAWPGTRVVKKDAGMVFRLRDESDLQAAVKQITAAVKKAKDYRAKFEKYEKDLKAYEEWKKKKAAAEKKKAEEKAKEEEKKPDQKKDGDQKKSGDEKKDGDEKRDGDEKKDGAPPEEKKGADKKGADKKDPKKSAKKPEKELTEPKKPSKDDALEGWAAVLDKKAPLVVRANHVTELRTALRVLVKKEKLDIVILGGGDARRMFDGLAKANVGVIAGAQILTQERGETTNLLRELALSDVSSALASESYLGGADIPELLAFAVRHGLSPSAAVRLVTGDAAKLLGVSDRIGTLEAGKDADLVLLSGAPFTKGAGVRGVFVGGEEVSDDAR